MNSFIASGKGFFKGFLINEEHEKIPQWTQLLREATCYTGGSAANCIKQNKLDAFVWKPFQEEAIKNMYEVVRRSDYNDYIDETEHEVLEWVVRKVVMKSKTDAKFLANRNATPNKYYEYEVALQVAILKNRRVIQELQTKIENLNTKILETTPLQNKLYIIPTDKDTNVFLDDNNKLIYSINMDVEQQHFSPQLIVEVNNLPITEPCLRFNTSSKELIWISVLTTGGLAEYDKRISASSSKELTPLNVIHEDTLKYIIEYFNTNHFLPENSYHENRLS